MRREEGGGGGGGGGGEEREEGEYESVEARGVLFGDVFFGENCLLKLDEVEEDKVWIYIYLYIYIYKYGYYFILFIRYGM